MLIVSLWLKKNEQMIQLFKSYILPQFNHPEKVRIIQADAFGYAEKHMSKEEYDVVFTDL